MGVLCAQVNVSSEHDDAHVREGNNASDSGLLYSLKEGRQEGTKSFSQNRVTNSNYIYPKSQRKKGECVRKAISGEKGAELVRTNVKCLPRSTVSRASSERNAQWKQRQGTDMESQKQQWESENN